MSFGQRRVWFLDRLNEGSPEFNVVFGWCFSGALDVGALRGAVDGVVGRHEALRTRLVEVDGEPVGVVGPVAGAVDWCEQDLRSADADAVAVAGGDVDVDVAVAEVISAESVIPVDVSQGPVLRVRVLRVAGDEWVVLFVVHHAVFDGWSAGVFVRELSEFYAGAVSGRGASLADLPVQYGDFAAWQRDLMAGERFGKSVDFWRRRLTGLTPVELPSDFTRGGSRSWSGGSVRFRVPDSVVSGLRGLAGSERSTLFMAALAGFDVLVSRWAGVEDVAVGSPVAGRGVMELEPLIGLFFNAVVLRTEVPRAATFRDVLRNVRRTVLDMYAHQDVPFEKLVEELRPARELGRTPLFQVWFEMDNTPESTVDLPGVTAQELEVPLVAAKFDVSVSLAERDGALEGALVFRRDLFTEETGQRLAQAFVGILEQVAADPDVAIADLALISEAERRQVVEVYNDTAVVLPSFSVPQRIAAQALAAPEAVGVVGPDGREFTFAELDARANQVAAFLLASGVGAESVVGVCLDRGFDLVATLVGVLRSGAAYVPLDPGFPVERCEYVLGDTAAKIVLTQESLVGLFSGFVGRVVAVDVADGPIDRMPDSDPGVDIDPGSLAYVIYTSGSTGRPKGVMVEHQALANFVQWCVDGYAYRAGGGAPLFSSLAFDAVVPNLYTPLVLGQRVHVFGQDLDLSSLGEELVRRGPFSFIKLTPSHLELLSRQLGAQQIADLAGVLVVGAEAFPASALRSWPFGETETVLLNEYGPTEATVANSVYRVTGPVATQTVPIGSPIPNTTMYVLDEAMRPAPVGVVGEVFIGGACVARGYHGRAGLTAQRFVPDPFSSLPGARLYRTGDRGRMLAEGAVEFLGRADDQVKIRGYRIEPGEIEAALTRHPSVSAAFVAPHIVDGAATGLIGYLVPTAAAAGIDKEEIRSHLQTALPSYLRPQYLIVLPELPLTPHGKIDRAALPAPEFAPAAECEAPTTEWEQAFAEIWQGVLGVERVGVHDDFFALGGHSLLAVQLLSRIRSATPFAPTLPELFEHPTISRLIRQVEPAAAVELPAPPSASGRGSGVVSFGQRRVWFLDRLNEGSPEFNVVFGWCFSGALDVGALCGAVDGVVGRHEALRTRLVEVDGEPVGVVGPVAGAVDWCEQDLRSADTDTDADAVAVAGGDVDVDVAVAEVISAESVIPVDVSQGPLLRVRVLRVAGDEWVVLFVVHHAVFDGWSAGVFVRELSEFYAAAVSGHMGGLAELPLQYVDFAVWQRELMAGQRFTESVGFWRRRLAGLTPVELPSDFTRGGSRSWSGGSVRFHVPESVVSGLRGLAGSERSTLFMAALAGFDVLVSRWAGVEDVAVGSPVAGRGTVELERLIGLFFNAVVIRSGVPRHASFREVLCGVRSSALEAYEHQDVPFEKLVEELRPARELGRTPLFQVWFEMDNTPESTFDLPGVSAEALEMPREVAKFDVSVSLAERDGALEGALVFRRDLFTEETGQRLAQAFVGILEQVAADPDVAIADLALMSEAERRQVVEVYNDTAVVLPSFSVPQRIAAQALAAPEAVGVVEPDGREFTFAELDARANQVAAFLLASGVGAEAVVGVCLDRGFDLVATLVGVLRSGAAYVPLDPGFPVERCEYVLGDTAAKIVLTQESLVGLFSGFVGRVVAVDVADGPIDRMPDSDPGVDIDPGSLAYVIYTSGSTGRPKGVMVEHQALANFVQWCVDGYAYRAGGGAPLFSSLAFDAVVPNLYTPLVLGQRVHVFGQDLDLSSLGEELVRRGPFSFIKLTPSHLELLSRQLGAQQIADLAGVLVVGAEAFPASALKTWPFGETDTVLLNEYGPTEATVANSVYRVTGPVATQTVPIGSPIPNTTMYVLDEAMRPAPVGVVGEVFIGGACVARGYHGRAGLTAQRFVPDPFSSLPGARLYRTGDRGRMLAEGAVEFLGRADDQVKIRGYRIEPGEIEAAITRHPSVNAAHVTPRYDEGVATALIAYLVPVDPDAGVDLDEISAHLRALLPPYLRPQHLIVLPELPLTPHGKIDRAALPAPEGASAATYRAPETPLERTLASIWQEVLGVERVGVHDDFFALGGHSLLAVQLLSRIRGATPLTPTLADLFAHATIGQLIDQAGGAPQDDSTLVTLRKPEPGGRILFCVHPSGGSVHWFRHLAAVLDGPDGLLAFQARGIDGRAEPLTTVSEMADAYLADLRRAQPAGPYHLLGWSLSGPLALEMAARLEQEGETVRTLLLEPAMPDAGTVASLRQCVADHRQAAALVDQLVAGRAAGDPVPDVLDRIKALVAESEVIDESIAMLPDSRPVTAAGLLYEAFCAAQVPAVRSPVTVLVTPECLAAGPGRRSKAATTTFPVYEQTLRSMIPDLSVAETAGDHFTMLDERNASAIIGVFRRLAGPRA
ncbi:amino acid adenylation domain-containing protein [Catenulispora sp. NF23]|uniref:amino acid adenylation domain-containing protein n=1 Tax=Catenulispora pinistramenti TaxID=2705254 RepID=UPI001BAC1EFE|nr:non-ribosomal peptide synthetase [Catenulispora pinistramenti]MBS2532138.1 amino acid adenylation domain-containing protein [Catenulispora pinistramenti]